MLPWLQQALSLCLSRAEVLSFGRASKFQTHLASAWQKPVIFMALGGPYLGPKVQSPRERSALENGSWVRPQLAVQSPAAKATK